MNSVDWIIIAVLSFGAISGFFRGFVAIVFHLAAIVAAAILSFLLYPKFANLLAASWEIPSSYSQPVGLAVTFIVLLIALEFASKILQKLFGGILGANPVNRLLGAGLGAGGDAIMLAIALSVLTTLPLPTGAKSAITESKLAKPLTALSLALDRSLGKWAHVPGMNLGFQIDSGDDSVTQLNFTNANPTEDIEGEVKLALLLDQLREKKKATKLLPNLKLQQIAQAHAKDMLGKGYFGHKSPEGVLAGGRVHQAGIVAGEVGENLAKAQTIELAQAGLIASPSHFKTMTSNSYTHYGIAVYDSGAHGKIVVQLFAKLD